MKKYIIYIFLIAIVLILVGSFSYYKSFQNKKNQYGCLINQGFSWCDFKQECVKDVQQNCALTKEWILEEAKKIIGLNLNIMPDQAIEFNTTDEKIAFSGKGIYYSDLLKAEKVLNGFEDFNKFLKGIGFQEDDFNPKIQNDQQDLIKYKRENIICALGRVDNPNSTSSLSLFCGDPVNVLYNFNSSYGRSCQQDVDCDLIVNGCARKQVCRTKGVKFYNDCENPSSLVSELDTSISDCSCLENQCVPKNEKYRDKN